MALERAEPRKVSLDLADESPNGPNRVIRVPALGPRRESDLTVHSTFPDPRNPPALNKTEERVVIIRVGA
jgi:hypothetical protein